MTVHVWFWVIIFQKFLDDGELQVQLLGRGFAWLDTGTHDSLSEASTFIEVLEKRQGLKISCLEEIAWRNKWISDDQLLELAEPMSKNEYGQYLQKLVKARKVEGEGERIGERIGGGEGEIEERKGKGIKKTEEVKKVS